MIKITVIFPLIFIALVTGNQNKAYDAAQREANTIHRYQKEHTGDGTYNYGYNTTNGITKVETGSVKNPDVIYKNQDPIHQKEGCYSYTSSDGAFVSVIYIADERGYHPKTRVTYPSDSAKHEQHKSSPCEFNTSKQEISDEGISLPETTTINSLDDSLCPTPTPCACPPNPPESFTFHIMDGSLVLVTYVQFGPSYTPHVQVLPPGWRNFYSCKIESRFPPMILTSLINSNNGGLGQALNVNPYAFLSQ